MTDFALASVYTRALDHFAGYGLSAILEQAGENDIRVQWSESASPQLILSCLRSVPAEVAEIVRQHAVTHGDPDSWVQKTATIITAQAKSVKVGLFSPRIAVPGSPEAWQGLCGERAAARDTPLNQGWLDSMMVQALGVPAYWSVGTKDLEPDRGASRWEMITRTQGKDFTQNRLAILAKAVAARTADAVLAGLEGETAIDEAGKNKIDSRSGTGLVPPGVVDNALAWCALWGLSAFRLTHRVGRQSFTPGAFPQTRVHPQAMVLPVTTCPTSPAKLRRILRSRQFDAAAFGPDESADQVIGREALRSAGMAGLVRFPVRVAGSSTAPERQVLSGDFEPL